ncbi:MAG: hypothetical protein WEE64_16110 [Dehalococcoidia bacterium]
MAIIGVIEAELQSSSEEQTGGIGPLFKETRVVTPFAVGELATRALKAMQKAGVKSVAALFIGEADLLAEQKDEEIGVDKALKLVVAGDFDEIAIDFSAMLVHDEQDLELSISVEGSSEYEKGEPALAVLVTGTELEPEGGPSAQAAVASKGTGDDLAEPDVLDLGPDYLAQMGTFLERLRAELDKELSLLDPDVRVWEEETADPTSGGRSSIPGVGPGI